VNVEPADFSPVVHQAVGMVSVQVGCSLDEAYTLLCERAMVQGYDVEDLAGDVVARVIRFA
jgi:AmiR/NasT family two-component response regulator